MSEKTPPCTECAFFTAETRWCADASEEIDAGCIDGLSCESFSPRAPSPRGDAAPAPCCDARYPHSEHQRCYRCGAVVAVPAGARAFTNSTLCPKCRLPSPRGDAAPTPRHLLAAYECGPFVACDPTIKEGWTVDPYAVTCEECRVVVRWRVEQLAPAPQTLQPACKDARPPSVAAARDEVLASGRDECEHGSLRRKCEICDLLAVLRKNRELRARADRAEEAHARPLAPLTSRWTIRDATLVYDYEGCPESSAGWRLCWRREYADATSDWRTVEADTLAGCVAAAVAWEEENDRREPERAAGGEEG